MDLSPRWLPAIVLAALFLVPVDAPAENPITVPDVFTYQMPDGFAKVDLPGSSYPTAVETATAGGATQARAMITVNADTAKGSLSDWCTQSLARNKAQFASLGAQVGPLAPFTTAAGDKGYTATIDLSARGRPIHYIMYFFNGGNGTKIAVTCACPAPDMAHYAPIFATAMNSFVAK